MTENVQISLLLGDCHSKALVLVVQMLDSAIHQIKICPVDNAIIKETNYWFP